MAHIEYMDPIEYGPGPIDMKVRILYNTYIKCTPIDYVPGSIFYGVNILYDTCTKIESISCHMFIPVLVRHLSVCDMKAVIMPLCGVSEFQVCS